MPIVPLEPGAGICSVEVDVPRGVVDFVELVPPGPHPGTKTTAATSASFVVRDFMAVLPDELFSSLDK
jgi:hypothetical protein